MILCLVMGRRKQARPHRSGGVVGSQFVSGGALKDQNASRSEDTEIFDHEVPFYVDIDMTN